MSEEKTTTEAVDGETQKKEVTEQDAAASAKRAKKGRRQVNKGQAHIQCTYNNTIVTITDLNGGVLGWSSAGALGFKGAKKSTPYAAAQVVNDVSQKIARNGVREVEVYVKGVGSGREAAIRGLAGAGYELTLIKDITPVAHNGCRPRKPRRV